MTADGQPTGRPTGVSWPSQVLGSNRHKHRQAASAAPEEEAFDPVRSDIVPGGTFPDYSLPDQTGTVRALSEIQGRDPLILTLARGNYCPKEHQQHLELAANYAKVAVSYTQIATIATDDHHTLQSSAPRSAPSGLSWPIPTGPSSRTSISRSTPTPSTTP